VVLHAAGVYRPSGWLVSDRESGPIFQLIADFIHIFRMPMLFFVSGLLLRLTSRERDFTENVLKRSLRLVVPFVVIAFTLNAAIRSVQSLCGMSEHCVSWKAIEIDYVQHLWFLSDLFLFTLIALGVLRFRHRLPRLPAMHSWISQPGMLFFGLSAMSVLAGLVALITPFRYYTIGFGSSLLAFTVYGSFFLAGCLLGTQERIATLDRVQWKPLHYVSLGLLVGVCLFSSSGSGNLRTLQTLVLQPVAAWAMVLGLWRLALYLPRRLMKSIGALAPLCYSIYLVHTFFVVLLGWSLTTLQLPIGIKFVLLTSLSIALSIYSALLVQSTTWLKFFLNGALPNERPIPRSIKPSLDRR
jgi:glucans biosynthesis protein C